MVTYIKFLDSNPATFGLPSFCFQLFRPPIIGQLPRPGLLRPDPGRAQVGCSESLGPPRWSGREPESPRFPLKVSFKGDTDLSHRYRVDSEKLGYGHRTICESFFPFLGLGVGDCHIAILESTVVGFSPDEVHELMIGPQYAYGNLL